MVYLFLADGFETMEALCPVDILRRAGLSVMTVSITTDRKVTSRHGVTVYADTCISRINADDAELLILPGGMPGASNLASCKRLGILLPKAMQKGVYIGAICAAPFVLGELGLLKDMKVTCYPGYEDRLTGALLSEKRVVVDKNIITAAGAGVSLEFALKLTELLKGAQTADTIRKSILAD